MKYLFIILFLLFASCSKESELESLEFDKIEDIIPDDGYLSYSYETGYIWKRYGYTCTILCSPEGKYTWRIDDLNYICSYVFDTKEETIESMEAVLSPVIIVHKESDDYTWSECK